MPTCCNGCWYCDLVPDSCDEGCCGRVWDCVMCKFCSSSDASWNKPDRCCCGLCPAKICTCCECRECRVNWCMCKCCSNNIICDPCAICYGEFEGDLSKAENLANARAKKGSPTSVSMER